MNELAMHLAINMPLIQHIVSSLMYHKGLKFKDSYPIAIVKVWIRVICSRQPYSCYKLDMFPKQWKLENNKSCSRKKKALKFKKENSISSTHMPGLLKMPIPLKQYKNKQCSSLISFVGHPRNPSGGIFKFIEDVHKKQWCTWEHMSKWLGVYFFF